MTLKTSLLITGDASVAQKAVADLRADVDRLAGAAKGAAPAIGEIDAAQRDVASTAKTASIAIRDEAQAKQGLAQATTQAGAVANAYVATGIRATQSAGAQRAAYANLSAQISDVTTQLSSGSGVFQVLAQQGGQIAAALALMYPAGQQAATGVNEAGEAVEKVGGAAAESAEKFTTFGGRIGAVAGFFAGPWGAITIAAAAVLTPLIIKLFETEKAAEAAKAGAFALGDAQSALGGIFDLTSGKIKSQNELLILNARLMAINLRAEASAKEQSSRTALQAAGKPSGFDRTAGTVALLTGNPAVGAGLLSGNRQVRTLARQTREADAIKNERQRAARLEDLLAISDDVDFKRSGVDKTKFQQAIIDAATARANREIASQIDQSLDSGSLVEGLRREGRATKPKKPPAPKSTAARDEFGLDAADRIRSITHAFDDTPPAIRQVNSALAQLDDLIEDLGEKKPPNFGALIDQANEAKTAVREGLTRPYDEFVDAQNEALEIGDLLVAGRQDEAAALRIVQQLQRQMGPLTDEQRQNVQATVAQLRAQELQLGRIQRQQQMYLATVEDIRGIVAETFFEGPESLAQLPEKLFASFRALKAEELAQKLFGDLFDELENAAIGVTPVQRAAERIGEAVDQASAQIIELGNAAAQATSAIAGGEPDIVVTGSRAPKALTAESLFGGAIGGIATRAIKALGLERIVGIDKKSPDADLQLKDLGKRIGDTAGGALTGAFKGSAASGFAGMLGIKQSNTGAALGGAVGSFLPIPGGSIIGGLIGGTLGGLFGPKANYGTATITSNDQVSTGGNNAGAKGGASTLAGAVQAGVAQIAEQLGGTLGSYLVSIGTYDDKFRVSTSGQSGELSFGKKNKSKSTLTDFGDDEAGAIAFAVGDAIKDGAVTGLSSAVAKALQSSSDVNAAIKEALKVSEIETLMGGIGAEIAKAFKDFETTARERVRIATQYGFDVVAIEKRNAEDRSKIAADLLKGQIGSLQSLIDEMTRGNLFEGSALDRITVLNDAIAKAKADLDAGVEGAGDQLAGLYQQRLNASKEAYGTTSGYAADRAATLDEARSAIARANARIVSAQGSGAAGSDPALAQTNAALDENNDQNARILAAIERNNDLLAQVASVNDFSMRMFDLNQLARV